MGLGKIRFFRIKTKIKNMPYIDKTLVSLIKKKREKIHINEMRDERGY